MESIKDQPDEGMRTTDFFDDTTDDEAASTKAPDSANKTEVALESPKSPHAYLGGQPAEDYITHCHTNGDPASSSPKSSQPVVQGMDGFLRLTLTPDPTSRTKNWPRPPERPPRPDSDTSAILDFGDESPEVAQARPLSFQRPTDRHVVETPGKPTIIVEEPEEAAAATTVAAVEAAKDELIMNAHTQTLSALLRDDAGLQQAATRLSFAPESDAGIAHATPGKKRVSLAPLPLIIPHGSLPDDLVRTPYPLHFRKVYTRPDPIQTSLKTDHETILPLSIRRHNHSHHPQRITHINLPPDAGAGGTAVDIALASPETKEKHFESLEWDDAHLFRQLRASYHALAGPYRLLSARSLQLIRLVHSGDSCCSSCHGDCNPVQAPSGCSHMLPRSPRYLESKGLADSFSELELMKYYRNPGLGKSRYAWVQWAKRISSTPSHIHSPAPNPPADSPAARLANANKEKRKAEESEREEKGFVYSDCAASLEFVEGWSWKRILLAIAAVNVLALAAALCWILLGTDLQPYDTGYKNPGERVAGGAMLGVFVLLVGWTWVGGWLFLSVLIG